MLLTHHFRVVDENTGTLMGALADVQAARVQELLREAGVTVEYRSFPTVAHSMHGTQPDLYVDTLLEWVADHRAVKIDVHAHYLPDGYRAALRRAGHAQPDGMPCDPGVVGRRARRGDGPPRHRHVAVVDLVARRASRRRHDRRRARA